MKARIVRPKKALLWGVSSTQPLALATLQVCDRWGVRCCLPGKEAWTRPVEELLETPAGEGYAGGELPLLLLSGLTDRELDGVLADLRQAGAAWPYKAVVTPHNRRWSLEKLYRELEREREAVERQRNPQ